MRNRALVIAPFWGLDGHVGVLRVQRFLDWLSSVDIEPLIVAVAREQAPSSGKDVIAVADPLGRFSAEQAGASSSASPVPAWRRVLVNAALTPDGKRLWAARVARDRRVLQAAREAQWIISTSPPESAHLAGAALARRTGARHVVDLRDGWLDEPHKWLVEHSRIQRARESRLEHRVIADAAHVFVVSEVLRQKLVARLPYAKEKVSVLTNAMPDLPPLMTPVPRRLRPRLLYAGRFSGSRWRHSPARLLEPLLAIARSSEPAEVTLLGAMHADDRAEVARFATRFERVGWSLSVVDAVSRPQALQAMQAADGLLLLVTDPGGMTAKVFEYLAAGPPILAVAPRDGAIWSLAAAMPQFFPVDLDASTSSTESARAFLSAARAQRRWAPPARFSRDAVGAEFLRVLAAQESEVRR